MNERIILLSRIDACTASLSQASEQLALRAINTALLPQIKARFEVDLGKFLKQFQSLRDKTETVAEGGNLELLWARYETLRSDTEPLLKEFLAFLEGSLVRAASIDQGLCDIADHMLADLSQRADIGWNRFTLVADAEFFSGLSGIIRLRFSDLTPWHLPIAAHEFGHYVAQTMKDSTLASMKEREQRNDQRYPAWLDEHFADLFAIYTLGPAFALSCAILRFAYAAAFGSGKNHPSNVQRFWWILESLRMMDKTQNSKISSFASFAADLETTWSNTLSAAGQAGEIEDSDRTRLRQWLIELFGALDLNYSSIRYKGWLRAQSLAEEFNESFSRNRVPGPLLPSDRIPDVLNGAWLARWSAPKSDPYYVNWLASATTQLCREQAKT